MYTAGRKKPEIDKAKNLLPHPRSDNDSRSCLQFLLIVVISYFVLSSIIRAISNSGSEADQGICYGTLLCFVIIMFLGARNTYQDRKVAEAKRKRWASGCTTALLAIVGRHEAISWWDDYDYRYHNAPNSLDIEMNSDQKVFFPNQTTIRVEVSQYVFDRLEKCNTVRVYYRPESPLTFLLEEEL